MLAAWSVHSAVAAVLLLSLVQGKKEFMDINTEKLFSGWDSMLRRAETKASAVHLRRQLQQSRLGQSIVGYYNILLYNDASCSSGPDEAVTYAYGFCDSIPGRSTGSRVVLLTTPDDGSSRVITNTTQTLFRRHLQFSFRKPDSRSSDARYRCPPRRWTMLLGEKHFRLRRLGLCRR
jgi:hypothetical protein